MRESHETKMCDFCTTEKIGLEGGSEMQKTKGKKELSQIRNLARSLPSPTQTFCSFYAKGEQGLLEKVDAFSNKCQDISKMNNKIRVSWGLHNIAKMGEFHNVI